MEKDYERILTSESPQKHQTLRRRGSNDAAEEVINDNLARHGSYSDLSLDSPDDIISLKQSGSKSIGSDIGGETFPSTVDASPVSFIRSSSFTLDDDDDDDEADLKRYNLDFSMDDHSMLANSLHGISRQRPSSQQPPPEQNLLQYLWSSFQTQRQQARQRRAQLLLQQSERDLCQSVTIFAMTYCDSTDTGIAVAVLLVVVWAFLLLIIEDGDLKRHWILIGCLLLALRIGARPLWNYTTKQRQRRRQQRQQLPQQERLPPPVPIHQALRQRVNSSDECDQIPSGGRYLDKPPSNNNKSGNLELQSITSENGGVV